MKKRKFYPFQVLRHLDGKALQSISVGQAHALQYFIRNSRKVNQSIAILNNARPEAILSAKNKSDADDIMKNAGSIIRLMNAADITKTSEC